MFEIFTKYLICFVNLIHCSFYIIYIIYIIQYICYISYNKHFSAKIVIETPNHGFFLIYCIRYKLYKFVIQCFQNILCVIFSINDAIKLWLKKCKPVLLIFLHCLNLEDTKRGILKNVHVYWAVSWYIVLNPVIFSNPWI